MDIQTIAGMGGGMQVGEDVETTREYCGARVLGFNGATSYQYTMEGGFEGDYETWAEK